MTELTLHGREVATVFDLLGKKENDITYSIDWGLANSNALTGALLRNVARELGFGDPGPLLEAAVETKAEVVVGLARATDETLRLG